eukprot:scaffold1400_cov175-Amphora_coffeaeformis.AAC.2
MIKRIEGDASNEGEDFVQGSLLSVAAGEKSEINRRRMEGLRCEGDDYEKLINSNGYPHCVQCRPEPGGTTQVLRVSYDYEMLYDDTENRGTDIATEILPRFEWGLMDQVSSQFHLRGCQLWRQENTAKFTITGLSSLYLDFRDITVDECEFLEDDSSFLKCAPVAGSMTLEYVGDAGAEEVEEAVLRQIDTVMSENRGTGGAIKSVLYVGERQEFRKSRGGIFAASTTAEDDDREAVRKTSIATSASAVVLFLALIGAMFVWRSKSNKRSENCRPVIDVESPPENVEVLHLDRELPSTPPRKAGIAVPFNEAKSVDGSENTGGQADDMSDAAVADPIEERDAEHSSIVPPLTITRTPTPPELATFTSSGSSDDSAAGVIVAAAAVPPPKDTKSETLKKHRKKKKKKKKVTLVRVNSRENIANMETISETDEQEGQDDLDEDLKRPDGPVATYSTSDDESAYSTTSSDNEQDDEQEVVQPASRSPGRSRRGDLPPLPPVEF